MWQRSVMLGLLLAIPGAAAETAPPPVLRTATGAFFALSVADVAATAQWYREQLGFELVHEGEAPNKIAKGVILKHGASILELVQHRQAKPLKDAGVESAYQIHGIFKIGFVVDDIDATYRRVQARHIPVAYDLWPAKDVGLRSFSIRHNAGNLVQFFGK